MSVLLVNNGHFPMAVRITSLVLFGKSLVWCLALGLK